MPESETSNSEQQSTGTECPECGDDSLRVSDAVYADCGSCGVTVERREVGL